MPTSAMSFSSSVSHSSSPGSPRSAIRGACWRLLAKCCCRGRRARRTERRSPGRLDQVGQHFACFGVAYDGAGRRFQAQIIATGAVHSLHGPVDVPLPAR
jgi:hypothetical protein